MPLHDIFRSPVNDTHSWDEVHGQWPGEIVRDLFNVLPAGFRAAPNVHLGTSFEVDVCTYDLESRDQNFATDTGRGTAALTSPAPTLTVETSLTEPDEYEVRVYSEERGRILVAAIEIVSPSNKNRPENRRVFVGKVASLLQQEVCVSIVDLVTIPHFNLYSELLTSIGRNDPPLTATPTETYAVTLRTRKWSKKNIGLLDAWYYPMPIGGQLPTIPLWLSPSQYVLLPLESSYQETCRILRINR